MGTTATTPTAAVSRPSSRRRIFCARNSSRSCRTRPLKSESLSSKKAWPARVAGRKKVLFAGLAPDTRFYFVHSYAVRRWELEVTRPFTPPVVTWAEHGGDRFVAAVENGPLSATQFHPEKSGDAGAEVLRRWVASL